MFPALYASRLFSFSSRLSNNMTSPSAREPTPFTLPVSKLMAMTDDQLTQFMKKHRDSTGIYSLPVDGWEKLSKDERERLASRLK